MAQQREEQQEQQPPQQPQQQPPLSEATALRLLNSVVASAATPQALSNPSIETGPSVAVETDGTCGAASCSTGGGGGGGGVGEVDGGGGGSGSSGGVGATQLGIVLPAGSAPGPANQDSVHSANEFGNSCRICRWHRSDMEIINCPCKCKGSVGYIHLKCLKRWIMHRRDNRCEICNAPYNITADRASLKQMMRAFCCGRCCGMIVKHVLFSASLMPLAHVILQQVLHCMDNLNQGSTEQLTVQEVFVASCALLTSSALFFHFFEFVTTRFLLIRNILRHWWMFGSTNDFGIVEVEDDSFDLF
ncbi:E3 ubiquitin-protein ligase MARCHF11 isoform X2 [Drosophila mojavensis]|uniref:Uncharacterized protein, isoform A n=1 Tax=Drosophila mojavensis TaxID=7230 RepID=B4L6F6_DROMO|nr:E3 ubiquitin-protein ligase MARCHF11 isoform X2 [Drosophila mojavensis]EDW05952.1 uncharacterized protein Dmoj_GI16362, isoform A [Drosophila mojavensis]